MSCNFYTLPHPGIQSLKPYVPGKSIEELATEQNISDILKLASNENPLGCSPHVLNTLQNISESKLSRYPSSINHPLRNILAEKLAVDREMLMISNGSDLIFCLLLMAFALHREKHILTHDLAFISYRIQAQGFNIPVISAPIMQDWRVDISNIIKACNAETALIFIASPNNPTGLMLEQNDIEKLLSNIPETTLLVLDEAYYEYSNSMMPTDSISLLKKYSNLVITRTFSKAYGLAGFRLGYGIAHPHIVDILYRLQLPFAVNQIAMMAALAALEDQLFLENTLNINKQGINQMQTQLDSLSIPHAPTAANFLTIDCLMDANPIDQALQQEGIIVRPLSPYGLPNHLRVTVGTPEQNQRFLRTFASVYPQSISQHLITQKENI